ncbi:IS630 family transposase [Streptomyces sp. NPDC048425]|uniref:IS630 family transposase n=1 Tax=Streptomyces sp. NPDC048425 TaxID=3365548 RepID=UPI003715E234
MGDTRLEPVLSEAERLTLESWSKRRSTAQGLAVRARIVLACANGWNNTVVAARLGVGRDTVRRWRTRFLARRLDGLADEPRPGVPRTITDAQAEEVVVRTLEQTPQGGTHWSKRELAKVVGISPASVLRIWHAFGLQLWRTETFKISPDPFLIDKIRDVVGLYLAPPANAVVFAMDEKPQIQALERTAPVLPMIPGVPERRSFDYVRHGTVDLFAALNTVTGKVITKLSAQHRAVEFRDFPDEIDRQTDKSLAVHVICRQPTSGISDQHPGAPSSSAPVPQTRRALPGSCRSHISKRPTPMRWNFLYFSPSAVSASRRAVMPPPHGHISSKTPRRYRYECRRKSQGQGRTGRRKDRAESGPRGPQARSERGRTGSTGHDAGRERAGQRLG